MIAARAFRHEKKPEWGQGVLVQERHDRLELAFDDGVTRLLLKTAPGLFEVAKASGGKSLEFAQAKHKAREQVASLARMKPSSLIKAFRIAMRDALEQA